MVNLKHILIGWGKSLKLLEVTPEEEVMSVARLQVCAVCPFATESSFLKLIKGDGVDMEAIACSKCGCPVNEKSLVKEETCPENKW
jgi:hypothetical protein